MLIVILGDIFNCPKNFLFFAGGNIFFFRVFSVRMIKELSFKLWPKLESGEIKSSVYKVLPVENASDAHAILERGENIGKVVLKVCD